MVKWLYIKISQVSYRKLSITLLYIPNVRGTACAGHSAKIIKISNKCSFMFVFMTVNG